MARWERVATLAAGAASGIGVSLSGVAPTGSDTADLVWSLGLGVAVAVAGSVAHRRVLLVMAAVAAVGGWGWWSLAGVGAAVLVSGVVYQRNGVITGERFMHAVSASLIVQALVRTPGWSWTPFWASALVVAVAIGVVLVAGWWRSPRRLRSTLAVGTGAAVVVLAVMGVTLWRLVDGVSLTGGTTLAAAGTIESLDDLAASANDLATAEQRLAELRNRVDTPLLTPLRFVPVAAQQVRALDTIIDVGLDLTARAGDGAALVEGAELRPEPGRVDVAAVRSLEVPLTEMVASLQAADVELAVVDSQWLAGPMRDARDVLAGAATDALPGTELALLGVQTVPGMLGADGPRRWLVQLVDTETGTNAWQVVTAEDGRLSPTVEAGSGDDVGVSLGDLSLNPDYPSAAQAAAERYEAATGQPIDGVITADSTGLDAIASLRTGDLPQGSDLDPPSGRLLSALLGAISSPPSSIGEALREPLVNRRIILWTADDRERQFLDAIDASGSLRVNDGTTDLVHIGLEAISGGRAAANVQRAISYRSGFELASGITSASAELALTLDGEDGTTGDFTLVIYSGLDLVEIAVAGIKTTPQRSESRGWNTWSVPISLRSGVELAITWELAGVQPPYRYRFAWQPQPFAPPTDLSWTFTGIIPNSTNEPATLIDALRTARPVEFAPKLIG